MATEASAQDKEAAEGKNLLDKEDQQAQEAAEKKAAEKKDAEEAGEEEETDEEKNKEDEDAKAKEKADKEAAEAKEKEELLKYEKGDLKLPEKSLLSEARVEEIVANAKERGLSKEQAQAELERVNGVVVDFAEAQQSQHEKNVDKWLEDVKADKDLGGNDENLNTTHVLVKKVVDRFASDGLKEKLVESGLGNYPELVRFFRDIGKAMTPEQLVIPGSAPEKKKDIPVEDKLYGEGTVKN